MTIIKLGTIQGRHPMPVEQYLINGDVDFEKAHEIAYNAMTEFLKSTPKDYAIRLYITGLTRVTLACVSAFINFQGDFDVLHDRTSNRQLEIWEYNAQTCSYESVLSYVHASQAADMSVHEYGYVIAKVAN